MELDVTAFHSHTSHLLHSEPSIDAQSWAMREARFAKKFDAGRRYIFSDIFTWLRRTTLLEQVAVLVSHPKGAKGRDTVAGGRIVSIDEFVAR